MSSSAGPRGLAPSSLANSVQQVSRHYSSEESHLSSSESFSTLSDDSSEDDEVVYSISDLSVVSAPTQSSLDESSSEDDYVLLNRRADSPYGVQSLSSGLSSLSASVIQSQAGVLSDAGLSDAFSHLQVEDSETESVRPTSQATTRRHRRGRSGRSAKTASAQSPGTSTSKPTTATPKKATTAAPQATPSNSAPKRKKRKRSKLSKATPPPAQVPKHAAHLGQEEKAETLPASAIVSASFYQEAVQYISTCVHPTEMNCLDTNEWLNAQFSVYSTPEVKGAIRPYTPAGSDYRARIMHCARIARIRGPNAVLQSTEPSPFTACRKGSAQVSRFRQRARLSGRAR